MDQAVLASLQNALDEQLLEDAVKFAVAEIEKNQPIMSKQKEALERELSEVDMRLHHLTEAIAATGGSKTIYAKLHAEEQRRKAMLSQLSRLTEMAKVTSLDSASLVQNLRTRVGDLQGLLTRQISEARNILRTVLNGSLTFQPCEAAGKAGYRFYGTGSYGSLLAYSHASNDGGGGQPIQPSLAPLLRFEIQGIALAA